MLLLVNLFEMKKIVVFIVLMMVMMPIIYSQNNIINNNIIQAPIIEKPVYIERYRPIYVEKPRVARKLEKPVLLHGYLWVYPEDLGYFNGIPVSVIDNINAQGSYGRNNWRIPSPDELAILEANAEIIGLGDEIYLATDHRNGVLRLVSTVPIEMPSKPVTESPFLLLGYLWVYPEDTGAFNSYPSVELINSINANKPYGRDNWRIPTPDELCLMEANMEKIGLSSNNYLATNRSNGVLRLVSTGPSLKEIEEQNALVLREKENRRAMIVSSGQGRRIGNVIWRTQVLSVGIDSVFRLRDVFNYRSHVVFPDEWRLPTIDEVIELCRFFNNDPVSVWGWLQELTSTNLKIEDGYWIPGDARTGYGGRYCELNSGYLIYMDYDGLAFVRFCQGTTKKEPFIRYNVSADEDNWGSNYGYIILVYDEK